MEISNKDIDQQHKSLAFSDDELADIVKRIGEIEEDFRKHKMDLQKALLNVHE